MFESKIRKAFPFEQLFIEVDFASISVNDVNWKAVYIAYHLVQSGNAWFAADPSWNDFEVLHVFGVWSFFDEKSCWEYFVKVFWTF
jgi:hypothetical protein